MPPKTRKINKKIKPPDSPQLKNILEDEKENCSNILLKTNKNDVSSIKLQPEEIKPKVEKSPLTPQKQKIKPVGFWSKKLQDLEVLEGVSEKDNCSLYKFDETEEHDTPYEKKKKSKQKTRGLKTKKLASSKYMKRVPMHQKLIKKKNTIIESEKKAKLIHRQSLFREQLMLNKEREKLADTGKKFTFSTGMPALGLTSTPFLNKDNLIGASNFLFLSPIIKKELNCCSSIGANTPVKSEVSECPNTECVNQETPKAEAQLKRISFKRVLRNGKVLST